MAQVRDLAMKSCIFRKESAFVDKHNFLEKAGILKSVYFSLHRSRIGQKADVTFLYKAQDRVQKIKFSTQ